MPLTPTEHIAQAEELLALAAVTDHYEQHRLNLAAANVNVMLAVAKILSAVYEKTILR